MAFETEQVFVLDVGTYEKVELLFETCMKQDDFDNLALKVKMLNVGNFVWDSSDITNIIKGVAPLRREISVCIGSNNRNIDTATPVAILLEEGKNAYRLCTTLRKIVLNEPDCLGKLHTLDGTKASELDASFWNLYSVYLAKSNGEYYVYSVISGVDIPFYGIDFSRLCNSVIVHIEFGRHETVNLFSRCRFTGDVRVGMYRSLKKYRNSQALFESCSGIDHMMVDVQLLNGCELSNNCKGLEEISLLNKYTLSDVKKLKLEEIDSLKIVNLLSVTGCRVGEYYKYLKSRGRADIVVLRE